MTLSDLQKKLIVTAFDPASAPQEVETALVALLKIWRKDYKDGYALIKALVATGTAAKPAIQLKAGADYGEVLLTFGKHKGKKLKEVDAGYLLWVIDNVPPERINPYTREAILRYLRDGKYRN
jgi:hypothetical protein